VSDTSFYDARVYEEQMRTEYIRQEAAQKELDYWNRKRELLEAEVAKASWKEGT